ncbi:phage head closure protein [Noviherbaspirillum malthae]|uniref:phage head closure protein n=1 Tax=Noviherbaspirillum malthae TaxID=1260987 RepID=UPI00188F444C|nr:phage head closure protein [Noviherbaspirillum malthae]
MDGWKLIHKIDVEQLVQTRGASGGRQEAWSIVAGMARTPAFVNELNGNERRATSHGGEVGEARAEIFIRYRDGLDSTMRVVYDGRYFNIRHIKPLQGRRKWLLLTCDTGVNDG